MTTKPERAIAPPNNSFCTATMGCRSQCRYRQSAMADNIETANYFDSGLLAHVQGAETRRARATPTMHRSVSTAATMHRHGLSVARQCSRWLLRKFKQHGLRAHSRLHGSVEMKLYGSKQYHAAATQLATDESCCTRTFCFPRGS